MAANTTMKYVRLGKSGLKVSRVILGCMTYGDPQWGPWILPEADAIQHIKAAYDLGVNAFDTANSYSNGASEVVLGKAIKELKLPRDEIVVMTKVCAVVGRDIEPLWFLPKDELIKRRYVNQYGLSRKHIFDSVKHSLERLQLDYIDLLQLHRLDPETPMEETMQALHDVVKAGYVRYIGVSSCYAWQLALMQSYARQHNLTEFVSIQNFHAPVYREEEREMAPLIKELGLGMTPWSPMGSGLTTRPFIKEPPQKTKREETNFIGQFMMAQTEKRPWIGEIVGRIETIAKQRGISMAQVSLAWSLSKDFMTAPIIGSTSVNKLKDSIAAVSVELTAQEIASIDELYEPLPVWFM